MARAREKLREWREAVGLSQTAAGKKVGVGQASWSAWEAGQKRPSIEQIVRLSELTSRTPYHVSIGDWVETARERAERQRRKRERKPRAKTSAKAA